MVQAQTVVFPTTEQTGAQLKLIPFIQHPLIQSYEEIPHHVTTFLQLTLFLYHSYINSTFLNVSY